MADKGVIHYKISDAQRAYALVPYVVGMFEGQLKKLSKVFLKESGEYYSQAFVREYLTTAVPQMRVIPVNKSITIEHNIATYDEIREIIKKAGDRIAVIECICRKTNYIQNNPCKLTDKRENCISLRDSCNVLLERGWGRKISRQEVFELLDECEKEGLVLQPANAQEPQFICTCCGCCCGILYTLKLLKRPARHVASNYAVEHEAEKCNGCGVCVKRCQMEAITVNENKKAEINLSRCIGCGLCVTTCKKAAITLKMKSEEIIPPRTDEDLYQYIMDHKREK